MPEAYSYLSPSESPIDLDVSPQSNSPLSSMPTAQNDGVVLKKRKIERACDLCRRKKTKCDGSKRPNNICTNCAQSHRSCTYLEASRPRGPSKAYITGMEDRLEKLEFLLRKFRPNTDFSAELGPQVIRDSWKSNEDKQPTANFDKPFTSIPSAPSTTLQAYPVENSLGFSQHRVPPGLFSRLRRKSSRMTDQGQTSDSDSGSSHGGYSSSDFCDEGVQDGVTTLTRRASESSGTYQSLSFTTLRFHGKSSQNTLIKGMRKFKEERLRELTFGSNKPSKTPGRFFRPQFWFTPPWEMHWEGLDSPDLIPSLMAEFPPEDLAHKLCDLYFEHVNFIYPLLHRPTFLRQFRTLLHHRDHWFACLCLSLFAVASRWCDDPRVIPQQIDSDLSAIGDLDWYRAGSQYFVAALGVHRVRRSLVHPTCLFEVQTFPLLAMFWRGTACQHISWVYISIGIRKAQDVGAHRKKVYNSKPCIEEDLWRRAFWVLVSFDRIDSAGLGRSCNVREEDFDIDLPLEVEDEYWEAPFPDPPSKPVLMTAFNRLAKLTQIIGRALGTLYAVNKSKLLLGSRTARWREEVVQQLGSALTEWLDSLPDHLKWTNNTEIHVFSRQSATLFTSYHMTRILIYRPFIPPLRDGNISLEDHPSFQFPFPAVSICNDAAKSCAKVIESQLCGGISDAPCLIAGAHVSAAVLLAGLWALKAKEKVQQGTQSEDIKPPIAQSVESIMDDISVFLQLLGCTAPRWKTAAYFLQTVRASLPDSNDGPTAADTSYDNTVRIPGSQDANGWQWYTTAQVPSSFHPSYTTSSHPHVSDFDSSHWPKHELGRALPNRQDDNAPSLPNFSVPGRITFQPPSQQACTTAAQHVYLNSSSSSLPRASVVGDMAYSSVDHNESADSIYDINLDNGRPANSSQMVLPDLRPATGASRRSHTHDDGVVGWSRDSNHRFIDCKECHAASGGGIGPSVNLYHRGSVDSLAAVYAHQRPGFRYSQEHNPFPF